MNINFNELSTDDQLKKEICFNETLIVSCGHYEGEIGDPSESDWSCDDSTEVEVPVEVKDDTLYEIKDRVEEEEVVEEELEDENDFHFFFYPECNKPISTTNREESVILVDGIPKINPEAKPPAICTCDKEKTGKCICHTKLPCECGAKIKAECVCAKLENICICIENQPRPVCKCKPSDLCLCHPDGKIRPICTCDQIKTPCICDPNKFPFLECPCKRKPKFEDHHHIMKNVLKEESIEQIEGSQVQSVETIETVETFEEGNEEKEEPCDCQKTVRKPCLCLKGKECTCTANSCICGVQRNCLCEPTDSQEPICVSQESKSICSCDVPHECKCEANTPADCLCFPDKNCTCGDPENCKCNTVCDCTDPCICDTKIIEDKCICIDKTKQIVQGLVCTCELNERKDEEEFKLKKRRAGKHGYRWCHEVDPRHTYFDYAYNRHDKISYKEQERERIKILGLGDEKEEDIETCPIHGIKAPPYIKKIRKPSIDCCTPVGGISMSVETLGEDKDKFLIQVVSHSSKEGAKTGTKLVSIVDCQLHTMEENRTEYISKKDIIKEQRSYMTICENGYYNKVTRVCRDRDAIKRFYHSFEKARNFLLEGANIVLLRYFGLRRYRGNVKTETVLMNGTICESIYVCHGVSQAIVNSRPLFVVKVERHIIEPSGAFHQTLTVLTLRGYTVSHEWADNSYVLHLNPLLRINPEKDEIEPHVAKRENWREDMQLLSDYLEFKSARTSEGGRYMVESGVLTGTIRDYLQTLLLLKPQDALQFTRYYFGAALSSLDLPHDEYFDPTTKHVRYHFFED